MSQKEDLRVEYDRLTNLKSELEFKVSQTISKILSLQEKLHDLELEDKYQLSSKGINLPGFKAAVSKFEYIWQEGLGDNGESAAYDIILSYIKESK